MLRYMFDLGPFRAFSGIRIKNSVNHAFNEVMGTAQPRLLFKKGKKETSQKRNPSIVTTRPHTSSLYSMIVLNLVPGFPPSHVMMVLSPTVI